MAQFKVVINFSTVVSEEAADELEYLVAEFVQGILNVVANDEYDQVAATIVNTVPADWEPKPGAIVPIDSYRDYSTMAQAFGDDVSDAPISAVNFEDDGPTDFDRR